MHFVPSMCRHCPFPRPIQAPSPLPHPHHACTASIALSYARLLLPSSVSSHVRCCCPHFLAPSHACSSMARQHETLHSPSIDRAPTLILRISSHLPFIRHTLTYLITSFTLFIDSRLSAIAPGYADVFVDRRPPSPRPVPKPCYCQAHTAATTDRARLPPTGAIGSLADQHHHYQNSTQRHHRPSTSEADTLLR